MDNNVDFERKPPYCNTGVLNTSETSTNGIRALIDWVSLTLRNVHDLSSVCQILNLPIEKFEIQDKGLNGYENMAVYKSIQIMWGTPNGALNMGSHINMSGQACREYETEFDLNINWSNFFALILNFEHKFTRLDIALDDFHGFFTIKQLYNKGKKGHMTVSRVKKARYFEEFEIDSGETLGQTLYIGKTNQIIRFYDKFEERKSKGYEMPGIDFWNRTEIQLRDDLATNAAKILAYDNYKLGEFAKGILKNKVDFKIPNKKDKNKSRWKSCKWWLDFLENVEPVHLTQIASDPTIPKIANWIDLQVNKSLAMLDLAFDSNPLLYSYLISKGKNKLKKSDENVLEEFKKYPELKEKYLKEMEEYFLFENKKSLSDSPKS